MSVGAHRRVAVATIEPKGRCCPRLHEAVELVGKRWTGAIVAVLLEGGTMRFSEIAQRIPHISDRLLSERMKELEARGVVERHVHSDSSVRVEYELTPKGIGLLPVIEEMRRFGHDWLVHDPRHRHA